MSVVAIIEEPKELTKIIDWAMQQEGGPGKSALSKLDSGNRLDIQLLVVGVAEKFWLVQLFGLGKQS